MYPGHVSPGSERHCVQMFCCVIGVLYSHGAAFPRIVSTATASAGVCNVQVRVLGVDVEKGVVDVSMDTDLVKVRRSGPNGCAQRGTR